jgi:hypothetical protein
MSWEVSEALVTFCMVLFQPMHFFVWRMAAEGRLMLTLVCVQAVIPQAGDATSAIRHAL